MSTFTIKNLRYTFILSNNAVFEGTNSNTLKVDSLRSIVNIKLVGLPAFSEAEIDLYGLKQTDMNALTSIQFNPNELFRNTVIVEADSGQGFSMVFSGQIITAGPYYDSIPHVPLKVLARVLGFESLNPANPASYTGVTDVATIVQNLATQMGYGKIENNGVNTQLSNPYFSGTLADQLRAVKQQAGIQVFIDGNTLAIAPAGQIRANQTPFVLTPTSGLVGYPRLDFQRGFVYAKSIYNSAFRFGGPLTLQGSDVPLANGDWAIGTLSHSLSSLYPGGPWFSDVLLYPPTLGIPPLQ